MQNYPLLGFPNLLHNLLNTFEGVSNTFVGSFLGLNDILLPILRSP